MSASTYKPEEDPVHILFKRAMETAGPKREPGHSFHIRVKKGDAEIEFTTEPPTQITGGGSRGPPPKAAFDKAKAMTVVSEYPDLLGFEEKDGKFSVLRKKYLDKEWEPVSKKLGEAGLRYSKATGRWEQ